MKKRKKGRVITLFKLLTGVSLEWTEDDYTGTEQSQTAVGQIRPSTNIANPISVLVRPVTYDQLDTMFPALSRPPRLPPMSNSKRYQTMYIEPIPFQLLCLWLPSMSLENSTQSTVKFSTSKKNLKR
jgi:hypothetical protein